MSGALFSCSKVPSIPDLPAGSDEANLDRIIAATIQVNQPVADTGIAVAVVRDGKLLIAKGYGIRNRTTQSRVNQNTLFQIGSTTKAFTAFAMSALQDDGLIQLGTPIKSYLPSFQLSNVTATQNTNTIDLLAHRTGLPGHDFVFLLPRFSRAELYSRIPSLSFTSAAGYGFRQGLIYNNLMYMTAGVLLEQVTGQTWESFVQHRIFNKLGMTSSNFGTVGLQSSPERAIGYLGNVPMDDMYTDSIGPAGSINSNILDMSQWLMMLLNGGVTPSEERLLSVSSFSRLFDPFNTVPPTGGPASHYGLGWVVTPTGNYRYINHEGHTFGFSALVSFVPELKTGIVILTNNHRANLNLRVEKAIYSYFPEFSALTSNADQLPQVQSSVPPSSYGTLVRTFRNPGYGDLLLYQNGANYTLKYYTGIWPLTFSSGLTYVANFQAFGASYQIPFTFVQNAGQLASVSAPLSALAPTVVFDVVR